MNYCPVSELVVVVRCVAWPHWGAKHTMNFFHEMTFENGCIVVKNINELLTEFNLNQCDEIL